MVDTAALSALLSGLLFGLSLIVAIGPQNAFVVRQGALRRHVPAVVAICAASDAVLLVYAALAARRALNASAIERAGHPAGAGRMAAIAACLAFTWLNPAVYLDTIVLLGSVAHTQTPRQWWFGAGAAIGSVVWFVALATAACLAHGLLTRPRVWRAVDCFVAAVMTVTALRLLLA